MHYQDWVQSHDWSSQTACFSVAAASDSSHGTVSRVRGREGSHEALSCESGQETGHNIQVYVEDAQDYHGHSLLTTRCSNVIDAAKNATHVILDLGCTTLMGPDAWFASLCKQLLRVGLLAN